MKVQLTTTQWLALPYEVRMSIAETFKVPRSGSTHMLDNKVTSDGYTHPDLAHITVEAMQEFTGSPSTDFAELFEGVVNKLINDASDVDVNEDPKLPDAGLIVDIGGVLYRATGLTPVDLKAHQKMTVQPLAQPQTVKKNRGGRPKGSKNKAK